jgi:DNA (cytosine-5)-methyltransferase 1
MTKQPKAISLFAGAGGCSLGFKQAGFDIIYATDFDKAAIETYKKNFPETIAECKDINLIDFSILLNDLKVERGEIDILIGGPPCQGFSTAGPRFWDDPRNHLLKQYVRALEVIQPKWFLMENVEGLLTSNDGEYVSETIKAFIELGYSIRLEKVYSHEYSVPQRRKRVLIIGNKLGIDFTFPEPTSYSHGRIFRKSQITLEHALFGLPKASTANKPLVYETLFNNDWANNLKSKDNTVTEHVIQNIEETQLERITKLEPGQTMKDLPEHLQHPSFKKRAARRVMDGTPSEKRGGAPSGLKRLRLDEPSLTITGAAVREFIHPIENRCLTIRECARIQTFPDDFVFCGSNGDKIQQIGNAIPPMLAKAFAKHILMLGFESSKAKTKGDLLGFTLSKSEGLSPALQKTKSLLSKLIHNNPKQLSVFQNAY